MNDADPKTPKQPGDRASTAAEQGFYDDARLYDILHKDGTSREVTGLERIAARFIKHPAQHWLEPACGSGRYLRVAAARGKRVTGFDLEPGMIKYAADRFAAQGLASRAHLFEADMAAFADQLRRPADFAFNLINTIRHLDSDDAMLAHLAQTAACLAPGGVYAVGLSSSAYGLEQESEDIWSARRSGTEVVQTVQYLPPTETERAERVISHMAVDERGAKRGIDSSYTLRAYSTEQWLDLIDRSDLQLRAVVDEEATDIETPGYGYAVYVLSV